MADEDTLRTELAKIRDQDVGGPTLPTMKKDYIAVGVRHKIAIPPDFAGEPKQTIGVSADSKLLHPKAIPGQPPAIRMKCGCNDYLMPGPLEAQRVLQRCVGDSIRAGPEGLRCN